MSNVLSVLKRAVVLTLNYCPGGTAETDQRFNVNLLFKQECEAGSLMKSIKAGRQWCSERERERKGSRQFTDKMP